MEVELEYFKPPLEADQDEVRKEMNRSQQIFSICRERAQTYVRPCNDKTSAQRIDRCSASSLLKQNRQTNFSVEVASAKKDKSILRYARKVLFRDIPKAFDAFSYVNKLIQ